MATLVLTTVGSLIGGPIGGALGAIIGQRIDQEVFAPKGRRGPRLGDLAVQTSSYGTALPKIFGTMRAAGTVIWSTDLREERTRSGGGKGRPKTTNYSYSASFAVALSARPVSLVGRIWADGNLLRGVAGDFKTEVGGFRLHPGTEDQATDPLIASAEGVSATPAYRGLAYAVFEDFQLAEYGNRIPSLTFEIVGDDGPVSIGAIADELSGGAVAGAGLRMLGGYAASGDSVRAAIETLAKAAPLSLRDDGERLTLVMSATPVATLTADEPGAAGTGERTAAMRADLGRPAPGEVSLTYYEPARDYQAGLQRARWPGGSTTSERIELAAALGAGEAKAIAEARLARSWTERTRRSVTVPFARAGLRPGELVALEGVAGSWRIAETTLEKMAVALTLVRHRAEAGGSPAAMPGRPVIQPDLIHGPTALHLFELPDLTEDMPGTPTLHAAAAGVSPGWRRALMSLSLDGGVSWRELGATPAPATLGVVPMPPGAGATTVFDTRNVVEVTLLNDAMTLTDADDARLIDGANLALIGGELIQFGRAAPLGERRWRLSRLLRGRRGAEFAAAVHASGERFVLIEPTALLPIALPASALGATALAMASGLGDDDPVSAEAMVSGLSVRPPSPIGLRARPVGEGFAVTWVRRSRDGWRWVDGVDAPLGEERELYRLTVRRAGVAVRTIELAAPSFDYAAATVAEDAAGAAMLAIDVVQIGTFASSLPASVELSI